MSQDGVRAFWANMVALPRNVVRSALGDGSVGKRERRTDDTLNGFMLHLHSRTVHPRTLLARTTWGLGVSLLAQFVILLVTGILLMVYYKPSVDLAYNSIKDLQYIVPAGHFVRNIHRATAHLMVFTTFLHVCRVFYTAAYKAPRELNWVIGMFLFLAILGSSFTGYLLPWDQLAYWSTTIGANIAASPNELAAALNLPRALYLGDLNKQLLLGALTVGQEALTRFYVIHVMVLPILFVFLAGTHIWRILKNGGLARPSTFLSGQDRRGQQQIAKAQGEAMRLLDTESDEEVPAWPYLVRAEVLIVMITFLVCVFLGLLVDAPLKEIANPGLAENPAKAPWYFLGLQEIVSYSAFMGGVLLPGAIVLTLMLIPFMDRESVQPGVWFSGARGRVVAFWSLLVAALCSVISVAVPEKYGWITDWFPQVSPLLVIAFNPGSVLAAVCVLWSFLTLRKTKSTRMGAIALFTSFAVCLVIMTVVGFFFRGPNWDFYWSQAYWPTQ